MSKSTYHANEILKYDTGQANALGPTITPYLALYTVAPSAAGGGTEVSGNGYARVSAAGKFAAPSGGQVTNSSTIGFPTATGSWGTVVAYGLKDGSGSSANLLRFQTLTTPKPVGNGDAPSWSAGKITLGES
jgi:hypothetical protein